MTFEMPEKGATKATEKANPFALTGSSLKDDLTSVRTAGEKVADTAKDILPKVTITGFHSKATSNGPDDSGKKTDSSDLLSSKDTIYLDPVDPMELKKSLYNYWLHHNDNAETSDPIRNKQPEDLLPRKKASSPEDGETKPDSKDDMAKNAKASEVPPEISTNEPDKPKGESKNDVDKPEAEGKDETDKPKGESKNDVDEEPRFIQLEDGTSLKIGKDGVVEKIQYWGKDGKLHEISKSVWKDVDQVKNWRDIQIEASGDERHIILPNGKVIYLDDQGRFAGVSKL